MRTIGFLDYPGQLPPQAREIKNIGSQNRSITSIAVSVLKEAAGEIAKISADLALNTLLVTATVVLILPAKGIVLAIDHPREAAALSLGLACLYSAISGAS